MASNAMDKAWKNWHSALDARQIDAQRLVHTADTLIGAQQARIAELEAALKAVDGQFTDEGEQNSVRFSLLRERYGVVWWMRVLDSEDAIQLEMQAGDAEKIVHYLPGERHVALLINEERQCLGFRIEGVKASGNDRVPFYGNRPAAQPDEHAKLQAETTVISHLHPEFDAVTQHSDGSTYVSNDYGATWKRVLITEADDGK